MATSPRIVTSPNSPSDYGLGSEHDQAAAWPREGVWVSEDGGGRPNSAQFSHNLWQSQVILTENGTLKNLLCMFPLRINGPKTNVGKLRMKPNLGGLDWKTTRQTCNMVGKVRGEEVLKFLSARTVTLYHENAWPPALLNPPSPRIWGAWGQTRFCTTQLSAWFLFQVEPWLLLSPNVPVHFESMNLNTNHPVSTWQGQFNTFYLCWLCRWKFSTIVNTKYEILKMSPSTWKR